MPRNPTRMRPKLPQTFNHSNQNFRSAYQALGTASLATVSTSTPLPAEKKDVRSRARGTWYQLVTRTIFLHPRERTVAIQFRALSTVVKAGTKRTCAAGGVPDRIRRTPAISSGKSE